MNFLFIIGEILFIGIIAIAIMMSGAFEYFFNPMGICFVIVGSVAITLLSFDFKDIKTAITHAFGAEGDDEDLKTSAYMWECVIRNVIIIGCIGILIGLVRMLQNLEDPAMVGPSMAMSLLTLFYSLILVAVFPVPALYALRKRLDS